MVDFQCFDEIRCLGNQSFIQAIERDLFSLGRKASLTKHIAKASAFPTRIAHGSISQLPTRDARIEKPAAVPGALVNGYDFDRLKLLTKICDRKSERLSNRPFDSESKSFGRKKLGRRRGNRQMIAHKESIIGSENALVKHRERSL